MRIVFSDGSGERELDLQVNNPAATVADLLSALAGGEGERAPGLRVGDRFASRDLGLDEAGLFEGASLAVAAGPVSPGGRQPLFELRVVGGLDAGDLVPLGAGPVSIGRSPGSGVRLDHPTVSRQHCLLDVDPTGAAIVEDLGSRAGTWVDGVRVEGRAAVGPGAVIEVGDVQLALDRPRLEDRPAAVDPLRHAGGGGAIPFNRPPREALPSDPPPLPVPAAPS